MLIYCCSCVRLEEHRPCSICGEALCSCLVIYNPIGSLEHHRPTSTLPAQIVWHGETWLERDREGDNCSCTTRCQDILLPLCLYTLANTSFERVHFLRDTHKPPRYTQRHSGTRPLGDSDCRQSEEVRWQTHSSSSIESFFFSPLFLRDSFNFCYVIATFCVESRILLHRAPFVLWPHRRKPSSVLTCPLPAVRLVIPCLSKMRKICADCCYMSIFVSITKRRCARLH